MKRAVKEKELEKEKTEKAVSEEKETKEAAVRDYLSHEFTFPEILKKYQIRSGTQL